MASVFSPVKKMKPEEYKRVTDVTYLGVVYGTLAALKRMLAARSRYDCAGGLGPCLSQHSAAICFTAPASMPLPGSPIHCAANLFMIGAKSI